jgi:putative endonuclease
MHLETGKKKNATYRPHQLGKYGEDFAELFLLSIGYQILHRNWRGSRGEIDIIARAEEERSEIIFIEVKTRSSLHYGAPLEAITPEKYRRLYLLGREWVTANQSQTLWRIDVVSVLSTSAGLTLSHHKGLNA